MNKKKIVCLTPIKNEGWILNKFLTATSLWADHIIIADQNSTDDSVEIARGYPKVRIIKNKNELDEDYRKSILLESAREIEGEKILISLDADEFLSSNFIDSSDWGKIHELLPGTIIKFPWINISPDLDTYWFARNKPFGFVDDNHSKHDKGKIHVDRLPKPVGSNVYIMNDISVLHFQYVDWNRMMSKHRWYQCWERINQPIDAIDLYRKYHHMYSIKKSSLKKIRGEWFANYTAIGLDLTVIKKEASYWWDLEVLNFIHTYGNTYFRKEAIWDINWSQKATQYGLGAVEEYSDPRTILDKAVHLWLRLSQPYSTTVPYKFIIKLLDRCIATLFKY